MFRWILVGWMFLISAIAYLDRVNVSIAGRNQDCPATSYVCTALPGYDAPTGLGTPNGIAAF